MTQVREGTLWDASLMYCSSDSVPSWEVLSLFWNFPFKLIANTFATAEVRQSN